MNPDSDDAIGIPSSLVLRGHTRAVYSVAFLPDGSQVISGSMDGTVRKWRVEDGRELFTIMDGNGTVAAMAVSSDGRWIATAAAEKRNVTLWNATTHEKVVESTGSHRGGVDYLSFSSDSARIASGSADTTVIVWAVPTGEQLSGPFHGHVESVTSVIFSPDGLKLASTDVHDIRIRGSHSGDLLIPPIELESWSIAWSPSGQQMYASSSQLIKCIDPSTGSTLFEWGAHELGITHLSLTRDGRFIAVASNYARTVRIWDTETRKEWMHPLQHAAYVRHVAISPNGTHVVCGTDDTNVYIWLIPADRTYVGTSARRTIGSMVKVGERSLNSDNAMTSSKTPHTSQQTALGNASIDSPNDITTAIVREHNDPYTSGGFADIYRGTYHSPSGPIKVAIKSIKTYSEEGGNLERKKRRLNREIRVWLQLDHFNVLPLIGTAEGFGRFPAMICPWIENGTLTSYLDNRYESMKAVEIFVLIHDVASGLHYLHSCSIVHGDLSGSNVLIRENGRAYICDFGLSNVLNAMGIVSFSSSYQPRGTLRWSAPELLDLRPTETDEDVKISPSKRTDVYSFGCIMLQTLTGKVPYSYYTREGQIVHAIASGMTPRRPGNALVTDRRWAFMQRCWAIGDAEESRPSSDVIADFTATELAESAQS